MKSQLMLMCIGAALLCASVQAVEVTNSQENKINKEKTKTIEIYAEVLNDNGEVVSKIKMFALDKNKATVNSNKVETLVTGVSNVKTKEGKIKTHLIHEEINSGFSLEVTPTLLENNKALVELNFTSNALVSIENFVVKTPEIPEQLKEGELSLEEKEIKEVFKKAFDSSRESDDENFSMEDKESKTLKAFDSRQTKENEEKTELNFESQSGGENVTIQLPKILHRSFKNFVKVDLNNEIINIKKFEIGEDAPSLNLNLRLNLMK